MSVGTDSTNVLEGREMSIGDPFEETQIGSYMTVEGAHELDLKKENLIERVTRYRIRTLEDYQTQEYNPETIGYYKIHSGIDLKGRRTILPGLYHGRFIDAIAYTVQQPEFYSECNVQEFDAGSSNNGYIIKVDFQTEDVVRLRRRDFLR